MNKFFQTRGRHDRLDVAPLLRDGLLSDEARCLLSIQARRVDARELRSRVAAIQVQLRRWDVKPGDRVAVMLSNSLEHVATIYALILYGAIWVPVNTRLRADGLTYIVEHANPKLLISEDEFRCLLSGLNLPFVQVDPWEEGSAHSEATLLAADPAPSDTLCIIYTSGTTGPPKGVLLTHRMLRIASEAAIIVADIRPADRAFMWEPLCHIGGAQMLMMPFLVNAELHIVKRFSATRFWRQWRAAQATHLHYLGGVLDVLMQLPDEPGPAVQSIGVAWGAGVSEQSWGPIRQRFGCELRECYGMTECSSFATLNSTGRAGAIGKALPWMTVQLLDQVGRPVARGEIGEIVLSSDLEGVFFPGYLDNPQATRDALRDGRLHTGDLAREVGDGEYTFVGRRTDSMRVRGENVSAWEVERVFAEHCAIRAVAAVGVASLIGEQEIKLYVQFHPGARRDWQELIDWARPRLADFQLPRFYEAIENFDYTPSERVRKHTLPKSVGGAWDRNETKEVFKNERESG